MFGRQRWRILELAGTVILIKTCKKKKRFPLKEMEQRFVFTESHHAYSGTVVIYLITDARVDLF